jgi:tRNA pseudouridine13 synthase
MKAKQSPDDFRVEELSAVNPSPHGRWALYRLDKIGWTTLDAVAAIRRRWRLHPRQLSFGGLKDRHAHTSQFLTIEGGPARGLTLDGVSLSYLGQTQGPFTSADIEANRFTITLRDLSLASATAVSAAAQELTNDGLPNYFDEQRFGSVSPDGRCVARQWVMGDYEGALRLALAQPYEHDRSSARRDKAVLSTHWGDWSTCLAKLGGRPARAVVAYLQARPGDFRGAMTRLSPELASLYLAAYQSHLWNRLLAGWLAARLPPAQRVAIPIQGRLLPAPSNLTEADRVELDRVTLPLPSARLKYDDALPTAGAGWSDVLRQILADEGLELGQLKLKDRKPFFSRGDRAVWVRLHDCRVEYGPDDHHAGRFLATLRFDLPRGSYATLLIKRVTAHPLRSTPGETVVG